MNNVIGIGEALERVRESAARRMSEIDHSLQDLDAQLREARIDAASVLTSRDARLWRVFYRRFADFLRAHGVAEDDVDRHPLVQRIRRAMAELRTERNGLGRKLSRRDPGEERRRRDAHVHCVAAKIEAAVRVLADGPLDEDALMTAAIEAAKQPEAHSGKHRGKRRAPGFRTAVTVSLREWIAETARAIHAEVRR